MLEGAAQLERERERPEPREAAASENFLSPLASRTAIHSKKCRRRSNTTPGKVSPKQIISEEIVPGVNCLSRQTGLSGALCRQPETNAG